jgi:hypothetical protein
MRVLVAGDRGYTGAGVSYLPRRDLEDRVNLGRV